jgi:23S rRNA (uracil1939-C5)-methyltransferase
VKLHIEKPLYGGACLARHEGQAVFVPFTLPGETVEARILENTGNYSTAELDSVLEPSLTRTDPPCPYFGPCGGCHYQHGTYAAQVEMKTAILREALERARIRNIPEISALTGEPFGYRNRIRLHVQHEPFALCYKLRRSHANLPVATCPIAAPSLQNAIAILTREAAAVGFAEWATELELFINSDDSALLAALWTKHPDREAPRLLKELWPRLHLHLPALAGAGIFSVEQRRQPSRLLAHSGEPSLQHAVAGRGYRVSVGSFFQVNRFLLAPLVDYVTAHETGASAWDLYSGVGLFSLPLAERFSQVTAVESSASSVRDLRENLRGTRHRIVAADTADFLSRAVQQRTPAPDLIVLDPPRAGLGREVTAALGQIRAPRLTYVSCDPSTLSRDLAALLQAGYVIRSIRLVDLFPQTYHLESVIHLARR